MGAKTKKKLSFRACGRFFSRFFSDNSTNAHAQTYTHKHTRTNIHAQTYKQRYKHRYKQTNRHTYIHTCVRTYVHLQIRKSNRKSGAPRFRKMITREKLRKLADARTNSHKHVHLEIHAVARRKKCRLPSERIAFFGICGKMRGKGGAFFCLTCRGVGRGDSPIPFLKNKGGNFWQEKKGGGIWRRAIFFFGLPDKLFAGWRRAQTKNGRGFFFTFDIYEKVFRFLGWAVLVNGQRFFSRVAFYCSDYWGNSKYNARYRPLRSSK